MSFEDLQASITKAMPDQAERDSARHSDSVALSSLHTAIAKAMPDQRKTHPKSTEGADQ